MYSLLVSRWREQEEISSWCRTGRLLKELAHIELKINALRDGALGDQGWCCRGGRERPRAHERALEARVRSAIGASIEAPPSGSAVGALDFDEWQAAGAQFHRLAQERRDHCNVSRVNSL
ncbi:MAG: hypothetical protein SGPRY_001687 [Prymnesium sp.]